MLTDTVIENTVFSSYARAGVGLGAVTGSGVVERLLARNNATVGVEASGADGAGWGLAVILGGSALISRAQLHDNLGNAVIVSSAGSQLRASDVHVRSTRANALGGGGSGLTVTNAGSATLERWQLQANKTAGIHLAGLGTVVTVNDLTISDTDLTSPGHRLGVGIIATRGARLAGTRMLIEQNRLEGVFSTGAGTLLDLTDAVVRDTQDVPCTIVLCARPSGCWSRRGAPCGCSASSSRTTSASGPSSTAARWTSRTVTYGATTSASTSSTRATTFSA